MILLVSRAAFAGPPASRLLVARCGRPPSARRRRVCIQLDHVADPALIERAFELGLRGGDGGRLQAPLRENVELVGRGSEPRCERPAARSRPSSATSRATRTSPGPPRPEDSPTPRRSPVRRADRRRCLAVSIGNVHGAYAEQPRLDWERLGRYRGQTGPALAARSLRAPDE